MRSAIGTVQAKIAIVASLPANTKDRSE